MPGPMDEDALREERPRCYYIREGTGGMAYSAFRKRWEQVDLKARRVLELARA